MGKGDRKKKQPLPKLADTPRRERKKQGRARMAEIASDPEARRVALAARCRAMGKADTVENRKAASRPMLGFDLGLVIDAARDEEKAARLWSVWSDLCGASRGYRIHYMGQTGNPQGATIAMVPDRMESDQGHTVDLRSKEEKVADAKARWSRWQEHLHALGDPHAKRALELRIDGAGVAVWHDGEPTSQGLFLLGALEKLADIAEAGK